MFVKTKLKSAWWKGDNRDYSRVGWSIQRKDVLLRKEEIYGGRETTTIIRAMKGSFFVAKGRIIYICFWRNEVYYYCYYFLCIIFNEMKPFTLIIYLNSTHTHAKIFFSIYFSSHAGVRIGVYCTKRSRKHLRVCKFKYFRNISGCI